MQVNCWQATISAKLTPRPISPSGGVNGGDQQRHQKYKNTFLDEMGNMQAKCLPELAKLV